MLATLLAQVLALTSTACIEGTVSQCTLLECTDARRICIGPGFGPCECYDSPPPPPQTCGFVAGAMQFYQFQGGFCPATRDCTGATYLQAEFGSYVPLRDAKFQIIADSGAVLGSGATDANGSFIASWCAPGTLQSISAHVTWRGEHKDNRFFVRDANGAIFNLASAAFSLSAGTLATSPQQLPAPLRWGAPNLPNPVANIYDGAWRTWNSLRVANRALAALNGLELRADSPQCPSSCAIGSQNRIYLDPNARYAPQGRVMHEMGHIVSYRASRDGSFQFSGAYCFPNTSGTCGWNYDTEEWASVGLEEGLATFLGDTALYQKNATHPHTCVVSAAACGTGAFDVEAGGNCVSGQNRWPLTVSRYLWDAYDSSADRAAETLDLSLTQIIDVVFAFPNGSANHAKDEPWCGSTVCDPDGRSAEDFRFLIQQAGTSTSESFQGNCSPVGD